MASFLASADLRSGPPRMDMWQCAESFFAAIASQADDAPGDLTDLQPGSYRSSPVGQISLFAKVAASKSFWLICHFGSLWLGAYFRI